MEIVKDRTHSSPCSCNSIHDIKYKKYCSTLSSKMISMHQLRDYLLNLLALESKGRWTICAGSWAAAGLAHCEEVSDIAVLLVLILGFNGFCSWGPFSTMRISVTDFVKGDMKLLAKRFVGNINRSANTPGTNTPHQLLLKNRAKESKLQPSSNMGV